MKLTRLVEKENGVQEVTIELTEPQAKFAIEVGLGVLLTNGAAQIMTAPDDENLRTVELAIPPTTESVN